MRSQLSILTLLTLVLSTTLAQAAKPPTVRELRVQKVGDATYFHVRFEMPRDLGNESTGEPRLVPQDGAARAVYWRPGAFPLGDSPEGVSGAPAPERAVERIPTPKPKTEPPQPRQPVPVEGLEFIGKVWQDKGEVRFLLLYPRASRLDRLRPLDQRNMGGRVSWEEIGLTLDLGKAKTVAVPKEAGERKAKPDPKRPPQPPVRDDLEGLWASAQVDYFDRLQEAVHDFGFYGFASKATARKYGLALEPVRSRGRREWSVEAHAVGPGGEVLGPREGRQLYETTTGAAAIAETLALRRMTGSGERDSGKRSLDVAKVRGIDVAEHPWEKMMAGKKPAAEPLADLVPHDNYYIAFKSIRKFIEFGELLDQWGTNVSRAYEVNSRDHRMKQRYEQQLCLRSTRLGKTLGPLVIRGVAITGSDPYLRDGSDVTVIFQVKDRGLFLAAVEGFLKEARRKFGARLKEGKSTHQDIPVESYVTRLRQVSLHRAMFGEYVVYSNSPVALRRVLDAHKGKIKRLSEVLDFQYMRTIFRADDRTEDGFAYLSDAFIRNLVGPASKIKEKRRLEALTTLYMLANGALFTAWETGKLPSAARGAIEGANLRQEELPVPEGKPAAWDAERQVAVSDAYNTIHFATPLIELPIDKVTEVEAREYNRFRLEYLGLWRQYFDPIGMRFALRDGLVKLDTYILPLVANSSYNELRRATGGGTINLDVNGFPAKTLVQFLMHLSPAVQQRERLFGFDRGGGELDFGTLLAWGLDPVGKWFMVRIDDSPVYAQLVELMKKSDRGEDIDGLEVARLVFQMPVMLGVDVKNPLTFAGTLTALRLSVFKALPGALTWEPLEKPYKGVEIVRIQAAPGWVRRLSLDLTEPKAKETFRPRSTTP
jgi:hypothetical protein